jgi:hypothetical protein
MVDSFTVLRRVLLRLIVGLFAIALPVAAQPGGGSQTTSGSSTSGNSTGSYYDYSRSGEIPIDVNIWGFVRSPGKYRVSSSITLVDLISLAGGPIERAKLSEVRVVHDVNVDSTLVGNPVAVFDIEDYQRTGNPKSNGVLYPYDTVIIPGDSLNTFNEILSIISNVAIVTVSVIGLIVAIKR